MFRPLGRLAVLAAALAAVAAPGDARQPKKDAPKLKLLNGMTVRLQCADDPADPRWLVGDEEGVRLVKRPDDSPGATWRLAVERTVVRLCTLHDPRKFRWLDGDTGAGVLHLQPDLRNTGTQWEFLGVKDNLFEVRCLGHVDGARWLDADIPQGRVLLRKKSDVPNVMRWEVEVVKARK